MGNAHIGVRIHSFIHSLSPSFSARITRLRLEDKGHAVTVRYLYQGFFRPIFFLVRRRHNFRPAFSFVPSPTMTQSLRRQTSRLAKSIIIMLLLALLLLIQHDRGFADAAAASSPYPGPRPPAHLAGGASMSPAQQFERAPPSALQQQQQQRQDGVPAPRMAAAGPLTHFDITPGFLRVRLRSRRDTFFACPNGVGQMVAPDRHNSCGQEFLLRKEALPLFRSHWLLAP